MKVKVELKNIFILYRDDCAAVVTEFVKFPMKAMIAFVSLL